MGGLFSKADDSDDDVESTHESEGDEEERDGETNHESAGDQDAHVWHDGVDAATLDENGGEMTRRPSAGAFEALEETDLAVLGESGITRRNSLKMKEAMEKDATQIITAAAATPAPGKMDLAAKIAVVQQKEEEAKQAIADRTA
eukprot:gene27581-13135_t